MFSEKLKKTMRELQLNQRQVCGLTGKSKASVSQYISGKQVPPEKTQSDIAVSLGLDPDYFREEKTERAMVLRNLTEDGKIRRLLPEEAADFLGMSKETVRQGLQQGVFPWGYAVKTSKNRWTYFINAERFAAIEGITV